MSSRKGAAADGAAIAHRLHLCDLLVDQLELLIDASLQPVQALSLPVETAGESFKVSTLVALAPKHAPMQVRHPRVQEIPPPLGFSAEA